MQTYRQRVYCFYVNAEEQRLFMEVYRLNDETLFDKSEEDPSVLSDLDPKKDGSVIPGGQLTWVYSPEEKWFHATMKKDTCRFESRIFPGKTVIVNSDM